MCRSKGKEKKKVHYVQNDRDTEDEFFVYSVSDDNKHFWMVPLLLKRNIIPFKIDTGAYVNIISQKDYDSLTEKPKLKENKTTVFADGGKELPIKGKFVANINYREMQQKATVVVCKSTVQPILSLQTSEILGLLKRVYQVQSKELDRSKDTGDHKNEVTTTRTATAKHK